jgi:hypothetical protein
MLKATGLALLGVVLGALSMATAIPSWIRETLLWLMVLLCLPSIWTALGVTFEGLKKHPPFISAIERRQRPIKIAVMAMILLGLMAAAPTIHSWYQPPQRAWISVTFPHQLELRPNTDMICKAFLKNTGRVPAQHVRTVGGYEVTSDRPDPLRLTVPSRGGSTSVVGPDETSVSDTIIRVNEDDIRFITAGHQQLYVYGVTTYHDGVRGGAKTSFCLRYDPQRRYFYNCDSGNVME